MGWSAVRSWKIIDWIVKNLKYLELKKYSANIISWGKQVSNRRSSRQIRKNYKLLQEWKFNCAQSCVSHKLTHRVCDLMASVCETDGEMSHVHCPCSQDHGHCIRVCLPMYTPFQSVIPPGKKIIQKSERLNWKWTTVWKCQNRKNNYQSLCWQ